MAKRINAFERLMRSTRSDDIQNNNDDIVDIDYPVPETTEFINEQCEESLIVTGVEVDQSNQRLIYNYFSKIKND